MSSGSVSSGGVSDGRVKRKPLGLGLERSSKVSLHQRFSRVMAEQTTPCHPMPVPGPLVLFVAPSTPFAAQMGVPSPALASAPVPSPVPALAFAPVPAPPAVRPRGRVDVRSRLGRGRLGYSSFRSEYGRRAGAPVATGSGGRPAGRPYASAKLPEHPPLAARAESRPGGRSREPPPTKRQLDAQLERYMSRCKSRLDADLDDYMARSKKRLDADLDEYMSGAGSSYWY